MTVVSTWWATADMGTPLGELRWWFDWLTSWSLIGTAYYLECVQ